MNRVLQPRPSPLFCLSLALMVFFPVDANAQMGGSVNELFQSFAFESTAKTPPPLSSFADARVYAQHRASGERLSITFSGDRLVKVDSYSISDEKELSVLFNAFSWSSSNNKQNPLNWQFNSLLVSVFPPLGNTVNEAYTAFRSTGMMTRTVGVTASGAVIPLSDWNDVLRPAGIAYRNFVESWNRFVMQSTDGDWYAVIDSHIASGKGSPRIFDPFHFQILRRDDFWDQLFAMIRDKDDNFSFDSQSYEAELKNRLGVGPLSAAAPKAELHWARRYAYAVLAAVDSSTLPMTQVLVHYQAKAPTDMKSLISKHLCDNLHRLPKGFQLRRLEFIGEVGDAAHVVETAKITARPGDQKKVAIAALTKIAGRHRLPSLPSESAEPRAFQVWASTVAPKK